MSVRYMIKKAQSALEKRYGFKPAMRHIIPLETDYDRYFRFKVLNVVYVLMDGEVDRIESLEELDYV